MQPPDDDSCEPSCLRLQDDEIASATFVTSSVIVDHQNITRASLFQRFQENVYAAYVSSRQHSPCHPTPGCYGFDISRSTADRHPLTHAGIGNESSG
jgi:hypothetical protein